MRYFSQTVAAALSAAAMLIAGAAQAASFDLSYTSSLGTLTATLEGTLQGDGNTVVLTSVTASALNGVSVGPGTVGSYVDFFDATGDLPFLTLDGSGGDLVSFANGGASDAFIFDLRGRFNGSPTYGSIGAYGNLGGGEPFVVANYSLTEAVASVSDVPLPAAAPMLLLGLGGLAALRRRG